MSINQSKLNYSSPRDYITIHLKKDMFSLTKSSEVDYLEETFPSCHWNVSSKMTEK